MLAISLLSHNSDISSILKFQLQLRLHYHSFIPWPLRASFQGLTLPHTTLPQQFLDVWRKTTWSLNLLSFVPANPVQPSIRPGRHSCRRIKYAGYTASIYVKRGSENGKWGWATKSQGPLLVMVFLQKGFTS